MRISLLRFFKTFQKYLAYAFLGLFISLLRFFTWLMRFWDYSFHYCDFLGKNRTNEINIPKFELGKSHKSNIWLMQIFPRTKSCIRQGPSVF